MKRHGFYTLHRIDESPVQACWHDGYTDGVWNYYRNSAGRWFAIDPQTGLSLTYARTRKAVVDYATSEHVRLYFARVQSSALYQSHCNMFKALVEDRKRRNLYGDLEVI